MRHAKPAMRPRPMLMHSASRIPHFASPAFRIPHPASRIRIVRVLLAGDVGGTKTLLGLFRPAKGCRPDLVIVREYPTMDFDSLIDVVRTFSEDTNTTSIDAAAIGVAGPVKGTTARLT